MSTNPSAPSSSASEPRIATGFDFEPLPNGDVLIQFHGDDRTTINTQVISRTALAQFPAVVHAFLLAVENGKEAAIEFLSRLSAQEVELHGNDDADLHSGGDQ